MREAAADERFEDAARYRNRLFAIENLAEQQGADRRETGSIDVLGVAAEGDRAAVQVFPLRGGKMIDRHGFHLENVEGQDVTTVLEAFALEYYGNAPSIPPQIVVPPEATGLEALQEFLSELRGSRVEVRAPARGEKRRLAELAGQNAGSRSTRSCSSRSRSSCAACTRSRSCARRSTSRACRSGSSASTSRTSRGRRSSARWSSSRTGSPKKAHYRKFAVRGLDGQDDFAAMAEVVSRRFARLRTGTEADYDEGFATAPNLVVIDGGKGQLSAALAAMQAYELPRVAVISLAKRVEEVFVPQQVRPDPARPAQRRLAIAPTCSGRGAPLRARLPPPAALGAVARVALRHARGRRAGASAGAAAALRLDRGAWSRRARRSSRACRASRRRRRARSTRSCTGPAPG